MINSLLEGITNFIANLGAIYTAPINAIITNFFPDTANIISLINTILSYITSGITWFAYLIPPNTRAMLLFIIYFWLGVWPLRVVVWNVQLGLDVIKRINIFTSK